MGMKLEEMDWNGDTKQPSCTVREEEENFLRRRKQASREGKEVVSIFLGKIWTPATFWVVSEK